MPGIENPAEFYRESYPETSEWRDLGAIRKAQNIIDLCSRYPRETILEIGAGEGAVLQQLSDRKFASEYHAVEVSDSGIAAIESRNIPDLANVIKIEGGTLPFEDNRFDLAVLSHVVEHADDPRALVREAARVARHVFIEVPLEDTVMRNSSFTLDKVGHINFYSRKSLKLFAQTCGLRIADETISAPSLAIYKFTRGRSGIIPFMIKKLALKLSPAISTRLFTYHYAIIGIVESEVRTVESPGAESD